MDDRVANEIKQMTQSLERLKSIENLLEEVAESNKQIVQQLERSWQAYVESTKPKQF